MLVGYIFHSICTYTLYHVNFPSQSPSDRLQSAHVSVKLILTNPSVKFTIAGNEKLGGI